VTDLAEALAGDPVGAARVLLGRRLVSDVDGQRAGVTITEVEAYGGSDDPASHAARGVTARNRAMFAGPGTLYVYRSYGVHWCMNVVTRPEGWASAVLIRGGVPVEGIEVMKRRRNRSTHLSDGPGKLAQALGVTGDRDGESVLSGMIRVEGAPVPGTIRATPRIGITRGTDRHWRFVLTNTAADFGVSASGSDPDRHRP
jgi:DNA-3-methyladenine glycosylase